MTNLQQNLIKLGFNESDALIYLILVENGEMDVPSLVDKSGLSRTTIYDSIENLNKSKLLTQKKIGKIVYYNIKHPQHLLSLIEEKKQADQEWERNIKNDIKLLTDKYSLVSEDPGVYIFHGKEEIIKMYEEFLKEKQTVYSWEEKGEMLKFLGDYCYTYIQKRIQNKMFNQCIAPEGNSMNFSNPKKLIEVRIVDTKKFPFRMDIKISGKKTVIVTFNKNKALGVLIDNQEIADNFKIMFNCMWQAIDLAKMGDKRLAPIKN